MQIGGIVHWDELAQFIRYQGPDPKVGVKDLWGPERTPSSPAEWRTAYKALLNHHWDDTDQAIAWANATAEKWRIKMIREEHKDTGYAAQKVMQGSMEQAAKLRQRAEQSLTLALATYAQLVAGRESRGLQDDL